MRSFAYMTTPATLCPTIVETLYCEALVLADEARAEFDLSSRFASTESNEDFIRMALSCEALRTTTRMMHAIAWLLNHRAHLSGELTEFQLRQHGQLPPAQPDGDPDQFALLSAELQDLVARTRQFYARVERLDRAWRRSYASQPAAVHRLRDRLDQAVGAL